MGKKATNIQAEQRLNTIYKMLLIGADRADIIQYCAENYEIGDRAADNLIEKANALYTEVGLAVREAEFGKALMRLNNLYSRSLKVQDYKTCLSVQREISNLLGLNAPVKQEQTHTGEQKIIVEYVKPKPDVDNP